MPEGTLAGEPSEPRQVPFLQGRALGTHGTGHVLELAPGPPKASEPTVLTSAAGSGGG